MGGIPIGYTHSAKRILVKVNKPDLSRVDLNLIRAFQVLMAERSVTGAAKRMFVSQPAMSKTLGRLRDMFDDPLFLLSPTGLIPTQKAMDLIAPVELVLAQLEAMIFAAPFDPAKAVGKINIQLPDSHSLALIPPLFAKIRNRAKNVHLSIDDSSTMHLELLASGRSDFSIYAAEDYGSDFLTFPLGSYSGVCWMRQDHPLSARNELSMAEVLAYPLVGLTYHDRRSNPVTTNPQTARIAQFYKDYRLEEVVCLTSSQLLTALVVVLESDALMMGLPFRLNSQELLHGLINKPIKEARDLKGPLVVIQHRRTATSQLHGWIREQILESWPGDD